VHRARAGDYATKVQHKFNIIPRKRRYRRQAVSVRHKSRSEQRERKREVQQKVRDRRTEEGTKERRGE